MRHTSTVALAGAMAALALAPGCKKKQDAAQAAETEAAEPAEAPTEAPAEAPTAEESSQRERGEYLVALTGCQQCHTPFGPHGPDTSKAWAGGLEVVEAFGTWRSPNITQHEETGIGGWSDEEIAAAIRQGVRPDGSRLAPTMPYPFYNALSDEDVAAIVAYLRTIEPIEHEVAASEVALPPVEVPPPSGEAPPSADDPVAHGRYLAGLMHCAMCHTPPGEQGAPDMSRAFGGGFPFEIPQLGTGVLFSSNLTPHETGIAEYTDEELVAAVKQMKKRDGSLIRGPMALYQGGWFQLRDEDARSLVAFLRSLPPIDNQVPPSTFEPRAAP